MSTANIDNRPFFGTIFGAIKAFCLSLIKLFSVVDEVIESADEGVKAFRKRQTVDLEIRQRYYAETAIRAAIVERDKQHEALEAYAAGDKTGRRAERLQAAQEELSALVEEALSKLEK